MTAPAQLLSALAPKAMVTTGPQPTRLAEALPNRTYVLTEEGRAHRFTLCDAVVVGPVTSVTPGLARAHGPEDTVRTVPFDDPRAVERTVDVGVAAEVLVTRTGRAEPPDTGVVRFRLGGLGSLDPAARKRRIADLAGLGRVVVLLTTRQDDGEQVFSPLLRGAGIGLVAGDGSLSFPALGASARDFVDGVGLDDLLTLAASPPTTTPWPHSPFAC